MYKNINSKEFLPVTYTFDIYNSTYSEEELALFRELENKETKNQKWIAKNPNGCCGKGIKLVFDLGNFLEDVKSLKISR